MNGSENLTRCITEELDFLVAHFGHRGFAFHSWEMQEIAARRGRILAILAEGGGGAERQIAEVREVLDFAVRTGALRQHDVEMFTIAGQVNRLHGNVLQLRDIVELLRSEATPNPHSPESPTSVSRQEKETR